MFLCTSCRDYSSPIAKINFFLLSEHALRGLPRGCKFDPRLKVLLELVQACGRFENSLASWSDIRTPAIDWLVAGQDRAAAQASATTTQDVPSILPVTGEQLQTTAGWLEAKSGCESIALMAPGAALHLDLRTRGDTTPLKERINHLYLTAELLSSENT